MGGKKSINIKSYKRKRQINIGIVMFSAVFIYLAVTLIIYASGRKVAAYEVREGSILNDHSYTGIALRTEEVVPAQSSGYINYLQSEYGKLSAGAEAYALTSGVLPKGDPSEKGDAPLSRHRQGKLAVMIQDFNENFSREKFSSVYTLKDEISNFLLEGSDSSQTARIGDIMGESGGSARIFTAPRDGIMLRYIDGYEDLTFESFKPSDLDSSGYEAAVFKDNDPVKEGEPAYKLVTDERWAVIIKLSEEDAQRLADIGAVRTRINKDSEPVRAKLSIFRKGEEFFGKLAYSDSMIRYAGDRFLNVEIVLEDKRGLKIPKSSLGSMDFYVIPDYYVTAGGSGGGPGVLLQKDGGDVKFVPVRIYEKTPEDLLYIGKKGLPLKSVLIRPDSGERHVLSRTAPLKGVFGLDKGYAEFKHADVICESGDYCIVRQGDVYGLHNYDHIAQDAAAVYEGEIIF